VLFGVVWCCVDVVWCFVVLCCVVWCGVVLCGVVWCGVVWCGVVLCCVVFVFVKSHNTTTKDKGNDMVRVIGL
jgi:hypothetical protein